MNDVEKHLRIKEIQILISAIEYVVSLCFQALDSVLEPLHELVALFFGIVCVMVFLASIC